MTWRKSLANAFGSDDCIYAGHSLDKEWAEKSIKEARDAGVSFEDYEKEVRKHCKSKNCQSQHTDKQVDRASVLWKYIHLYG